MTTKSRLGGNSLISRLVTSGNTETPTDTSQPGKPKRRTKTLNEVVTEGRAREAKKARKAKQATPAKPEKRALSAEPVKVTARLPAELTERVRDAVFYTPGLTLDALGTDAYERAIKALERKRGEPFPRRTAPVKRGRPVK